MKRNGSIALALALALAALGAGLSLSTASVAQPAPQPDPAAGPQARTVLAQRADRVQRRQALRQAEEARMDALRAALQLTPAQEADWTAYQEALRQASAEPMMNSAPGRRANLGPSALAALKTTPQRVDLMVDLSSRRHAAVTARAAATKRFYARLTPAQQKAFDDQPIVIDPDVGGGGGGQRRERGGRP